MRYNGTAFFTFFYLLVIFEQYFRYKITKSIKKRFAQTKKCRVSVFFAGLLYLPILYSIPHPTSQTLSIDDETMNIFQASFSDFKILGVHPKKNNDPRHLLQPV